MASTQNYEEDEFEEVFEYSFNYMFVLSFIQSILLRSMRTWSYVKDSIRWHELLELDTRGLYYLDIRLSMSCLAIPSPKLLHECSGHPRLSKLKSMIPELNKLQNHIWNTYQLRKYEC